METSTKEEEYSSHSLLTENEDLLEKNYLLETQLKELQDQMNKQKALSATEMQYLSDVSKDTANDREVY